MTLLKGTSGRGRRRAAVAAIVLLAAASAVWCSQAIRKAERQSGNDLVGYLAASRALYSGGDPYHLPGRFPYIYPLFLAAAIRPLTVVPLAAACIMWFALQCACLLYVLWRIAADARVEVLDKPLLAAAIVATFGDVLQNEFLNGQVNVIVLALVVAAVHLTERKPHAASALLGAAIAVKLTPALFLMYWLVERRYRHVIESTLWAVVFVLSPWLLVQNGLWPLYESYVRDFILARTAAEHPHADGIFFTMYGFWGWLTGSAPGRLVMVGTSIGVVAALVLWHAQLRNERRVAWIYASATPMLTPLSEVHHLTLLIPAAVVSAVALFERASALLVTASALFVVLIWIARFDRTGPWYFCSAVCLIATASIVVQRRAEA